VLSTTPPPPSPAPSRVEPADWRLAPHWPDLAVAVTTQAVDSVDHLLRGLALLVQRGRLSEAEYHILAQPALRLKRCSIQVQQIVRLHSGQVRQTHEKIDLAQIVESVLQERRDELALAGVTVVRQLHPVELLIDPTLAYSLVQTLLEWGLQHGNLLDWRVEPRAVDSVVGAGAALGGLSGWLELSVASRDADTAAAAREDGVVWLLAQQLARTDGGIVLQRDRRPNGWHLRAQFRRAVGR